MNISNTKPLLNAALVFLLAVLASPHSSGNFSAKDVFLSDTTISAVGIQNNYSGSPEDDSTEINRSPEWVCAPLQKSTFTRLPDLAPEPDIAFTVSQARAPPQH